MSRKTVKKNFKIQQELALKASEKLNEKIQKLGEYSSALCMELNKLQKCFDDIRGVPTENVIELNELSEVRLNWLEQVDKITDDYKITAIKVAGKGAAGIGAGVGVATLAPNVAMGIATTYGVASTGTAISSLSGVVAQNAALAWLGGGAVSAGGGGMAAGSYILGLSNPVGMVISGVSFLVMGLTAFKSVKEKNKLETVFTAISMRDTNHFKLAILEINERIEKISEEIKLLLKAIDAVKSFGTEYNMMSEHQKYNLFTFVNLMNSSTQLLVNPIRGLQPKFDGEDFNRISQKIKSSNIEINKESLELIVIFLSNQLYGIEINESEKKLLWRSLIKNKDFLQNMEVNKKELNIEIIDLSLESLKFKYVTENILRQS